MEEFKVNKNWKRNSRGTLVMPIEEKRKIFPKEHSVHQKPPKPTPSPDTE